MSSSFFLKKEQRKSKRKLQDAKSNDGYKGRNKRISKGSLHKKVAQLDDEVASDEEYKHYVKDEATNLVFSSNEAEESAQDKRLRLAKKYLKEIETQEADIQEERRMHDQVAHRLQTEYLESVGKLRRYIASSIESYDLENLIKLKHKKQHLAICSLALSLDGSFLFTGAKTQHVLKWSLKTNRIEGLINVKVPDNDKNEESERSHVIAMCLSSDFNYLALSSGGKTIQIWNPKNLKHIKSFQGHRDVVTALVFRKDTHELYSASRDRSVKIWSLDEMAYIETLFGHQAAITDIDALSRERAITSGGADCTLRIWKITEESQLIYNGHRDSAENVRFINDENFISSGVDGSLCLWSVLKKKPLYAETFTHGLQSNGEANWITAIACVVNTDLIASGSCDGFIRLWQCGDNYRKLKLVLKVPVQGFVNNLAFNSNGTKLYAALGQEHKWGRWWRLPYAKNQIIIINLIRSSTEKQT